MSERIVSERIVSERIVSELGGAAGLEHNITITHQHGLFDIPDG